MGSIKPIGTIAECYAHAVAVEREAAARYAEFSELMAERGEEATAQLFQSLARFDEEHAGALTRRASELPLPHVATTEHAWVDDAEPEAVSHALLRLMSAHDALRIALDNEERAREFFDGVASRAQDPAARKLAAEMSAEESLHIARLRDALTHTPRPMVWEEHMFPVLSAVVQPTA
jgi:rubrerythrin